MTRPQPLRPATGEVRIRVVAIGISPFGTQIAGVVEAVAPASAGFARGDRVTFRASEPPSAARMVVSERDLIGVPSDVSLEAAAGVLPGAGIARNVVRQVRRLRSGDRVRIDAATADLAPYLSAWARHVGAEVVTEGPADAAITATDIAAARSARAAHGSSQQVAADVYAAIRAGAFDAVGAVGRVLPPGEVTLAA